MKAIVCVDSAMSIGKNNDLLIHIPADMKRFKELTIGHTVVMGGNTFRSIPTQLPGREMVVLTRQESLPYGTICHTVEELLSKYNTDDTFVIGGGEIYRLLLPYCDTVYMTKVYKYLEGTVKFPDLHSDEWALVETSGIQTYKDTMYTYLTYKRR